MKKTEALTADSNTSFDKYLQSSIRLNRNLNINTEVSGVEIIELDESDTSESEDEIRSMVHEHAWCYSNDVRRTDDNYNINKKAREKWRMKNKIHPGFPSESSGYPCQGTKGSRACAMNYVPYVAERDAQPVNTLNCFTIVKNDVDDSDSSSDKENSVEITECGDVVLERNQLSNDDNFKRIKCNNRLDNTRTILIYSFKNRNMLSDDDNQPFESSEGSTSDSSLENFERVLFDENNAAKNRVPSPSPAPYIPRLDFLAAATLPTVAEVIEPYQLSSENIMSYKNNTPNLPKPKGNDNELHEDKLLDNRGMLDQPTDLPIPSNNIINWMALSPRKRIKQVKIREPSEVKHILFEDRNLMSDAQNAKYSANGDDAIISLNISDVETNTGKHDVHDPTDGRHVLEKINNQYLIDEKGDHEKIKQLKKPQIRFDKIAHNSIITDPIEKLNGDEWIGRDDEQIDKLDFSINASKDSEDNQNKPMHANRCAGDRLFRKNMSLLRPVEWAEYLPITESMPSLHLSLPSDLNEGKKSWFKRFIELVQRCVKCK